ncbi:Ig-like domain-containing protein [Verrucomicrobiota bacterium]
MATDAPWPKFHHDLRNTGHVSPFVSIGSVAPDPTRDSPIPVSVTFTENVTGFTNTDITAGNGTVSNFTTVSPSNYTFNLVPSGQGMVTADIAAGVCMGSSESPNMAATQFSRAYDSESPSVTISSMVPDPTKDSPIPLTVIFTEDVIGFTNTDITAGNGTVANFATASPSNYTFNLVPSGQGLVTADIAAGICEDSAANSNSIAAQFTRTYDSVQPSVSMSSPAPDPTRDSPIPVTVIFTENMIGFTNTDITAGNGTVANFTTVSASNYTFSLVPSGEGTVTADIAAGVCQDSAGNSNLVSAQFSRTYDTVQPGVSMSSPAPDPTRDSPIPVAVIFTENVTSFTNTDITAGNGTVANFATVSPSNYTFNLVPSGEGTVTADIAAGVCQDSAGNSNTAATQLSLAYDISPPSPDPLTWQTSPTALSPTSIWMSAVSAVDTNAPVSYLFTNITAGPISGWQTGSGWTNSGLNANTLYGFRAKARDALANETAWSSTNSIYTHANVPLAPAPLPVGTDTMRVTLNAAVTGGVYNADGNPSDTEYAVGIVPNGGATNYVNFSGGLTNNAFWGVFTNWGGTNGLLVTNLDNTVTYVFLVKARNQENVTTVFGPSTNVIFDPRVVLNTLVQTNDGSGLLFINVTVSNPRTNDCLLRMEFGYYGEGTGKATNTAWLATEVAAEYGTPLVTNAGLYQITDISTTNFTNTLTFAWDTQSAGNSPSLAQVYTNVWVGFRLYDPLTNITSSTERTSVWVDNDQPTCTIDRTGASPTNAGQVGFSIVFSEAVSNFSLADIKLLTSGTSGELSAFSGSGAGYTVEVVNVTGDGSLGIRVNSNKCTDIFGNANAGVVSTYYTIDQTAPIVTISDPSASITNSGPVTYTVTYSGADNVSLITNDISLNMTSTANGTVTVSGTGTSTRMVTISDITGDGTLGISLAGNTAQDTVGNQANGVTGTSFTVENTSPSVTMSSTAEDPTAVFPITVTVTFSESVTEFTIADIRTGNATAGNLVTISASEYTFELTPSGQGTFFADIDAGAAHDAAGNGNTAAAQFSRDYEISIPANVSASDGTYTDKVRVTWDSVEGATAYEIWRNTTSEPLEAYCIASDHTSLSYDDTSASVGQDYYYWIKAKNSLGTSAFSGSDSGWRRSAASTGDANNDMDGDGLLDLTVYQEDTGYWYTLLSASGTIASQNFGEPGYVPVPGDYDGDGKTDLALYHEASGYWYILPSSTYSLSYQKFGEPGYIPVPGDYDGDGKTDLAVYHEATGYWYILPSSTYSLSYQKFGESGYAPVPSDFDGDGKTDLAVYHEASGYWYILPSATYSLSYQKLGESEYAPVPSDFDGDGKADLAVYHEDSGYWYILSSATGTLSYQKLGETGYEPVPADYDGDGKADLAVYHEDSGYWYMLLSESGTISYMQFGGPGYVPVGVMR